MDVLPHNEGAGVVQSHDVDFFDRSHVLPIGEMKQIKEHLNFFFNFLSVKCLGG